MKNLRHRYWCFFVGLCFLMSLWIHSIFCWSAGSIRWGADHYRGFGFSIKEGCVRFWGGRPYQGIFSYSWTGSRVFQRGIEVDTNNILADTIVTIEWEAVDRCSIKFSFWFLVLLYCSLGSLPIIVNRRDTHRLGDSKMLRQTVFRRK